MSQVEELVNARMCLLWCVQDELIQPLLQVNEQLRERTWSLTQEQLVPQVRRAVGEMLINQLEEELA